MKTKAITPVHVPGQDPRAIISTAAVDSEGDVVVQAGLRFRPNMRVTFSHDYRALPVGVVTSIAQSAGRTEATWRWITGDEFVDRVKNVYEQGGLDASIGFRVIAADPRKGGTGYTITEAEVIEFSLTAVPANAACVALVKALDARGSGAVLERAADAPGLEVTPAAVTAALREVITDEVRRALPPAILFPSADPGDEAFLALADEAAGGLTLVDLDPDAARAAVAAEIKSRITTEVRRAVNALRGRIDD